MVDAFGMMIARGQAIKPGSSLELASIYDMAPTLLYLLDQNVPEDMDGRVLSEAILESHLQTNPIRLSASNEQDGPSELEFSPEENVDVIERLKQLGYIG